MKAGARYGQLVVLLLALSPVLGCKLTDLEIKAKELELYRAASAAPAELVIP